jgi:arylsulfatase A-like enzyme
MAALAGGWLFLGVLEVALGALIPGTSLRDPELSALTRIGLTASGLALLLVAVFAVGMPLYWLGRGWLAVVWIAVVLYGASWAALWNVGVFLDREALAFWLPHPIQVFHWVYPPFALGVLVSTLIISGIVTIGIPRWVASRPHDQQRRLVQVAGAIAFTCVVAALSSAFAGPDRSPGVTRAAAIRRAAGVSPLLHLLDDERRRRRMPVEASRASVGSDQEVIRRPIISMEQYLAHVPASRRAWNVVMVQIESLRSDQLRAYGSTRDVMPAIDAVARESRVFTKAYIQASHSNYADLVPLSSQYPLRAREMYVYPPNPAFPRVLIYDVLKALGYRTAIFSSQNENWGGMVNFHRRESLDRFFHAETFAGPTYTPWEDTGFAEWVKQTQGAGSVDDRYTVDEAIRWVESVVGTPFFLHMNLQSSHVPYVVPKDFPRRFSPAELAFTIMWGKFPQDRVQDVKDRYADSLLYADTQLARLFDVLRARGLWEDTVIVIGGDNGEAFYEHGFAAHASWLFDEVVKVPMLIRAPGLPPGPDDRPAMFLDIAPSILDLLGLPPHPGFQGTSLLRFAPDPERSIYMIVQTPSAYESAIVRSGFKLHFPEQEGVYILNDLARDPGETIDFAASRPDLVADLAARLKRWRDEQLAYYDDPSRQAREYPPVIPD